MAKGIYDQAVYRATADWNLIQNFSHPVSFTHHADGFGVEGQMGVEYAIGGIGLFLSMRTILTGRAGRGGYVVSQPGGEAGDAAERGWAGWGWGEDWGEFHFLKFYLRY